MAMLETTILALLIVAAGVGLLVAAWALHWMMRVAGVVLVGLGIYLALGGQVAGL